MHYETVAAAYDELADRWRDDQFPADNGISQHTRALSFLPNPAGPALNVGCGCNTRFNQLLRDNGLRPEGIDVSERMVRLARVADPETPVHHADICEWQISRRYSFITAWDSIWHVSLQKQRGLLLKLLGALEPGGVFLFTAGGLDDSSEHTDSYMGPSLYYASLGIPELLRILDEGNAICRHLEFDQLPEKHLVIIAQRAT